MVTAQFGVTQHTPHWPEHLPGSMARIRQTRAASKHQKAKVTRNKIAQTEPDPHLQCPRLLPSMGDLASQRRHSSLAARNISQLPGLHKRMGAWSCLQHSQGHSHPHGQGQSLLLPLPPPPMSRGGDVSASLTRERWTGLSKSVPSGASSSQPP